MVRIVYKIDELLDLRHNEIVNLKHLLPKLLPGTNHNKLGKVHQHITKSFPKFKNNIRNTSYSKSYLPHLKENKYAPDNSYDRRISGIQMFAQDLNDNNTSLSSMNCYDGQIEYPLFNWLIFPPGSRIICIEPGNPLPQGAIPIPFRFEDEFSKPVDIMRRLFVNQSNLYQNELQKGVIDNAKYKKYKNNTNLQYPIRTTNFQSSKNRTIKPISNPYSVTGFFPGREIKEEIIMPENTNTSNPKTFSHTLPNNSQTSINDTDSSATIGSSSCDSFNIQIQISATH